MPTVSFSASLNLDGRAVSLAKSYAAGILHERRFELAAGAVRELAFDATAEGATVKFLYIKATKTAEPTLQAEVMYGVTDAEASAPSTGTGWTEINGILVSWAEQVLSANNKLYIYNAGNDRITVDLAIGLEG